MNNLNNESFEEALARFWYEAIHSEGEGTEDFDKAKAPLIESHQSALKAAVREFAERVKQHLPNPDNNVEEWRGHNLGLSQALTAIDIELTQALDKEAK